MDNTLLTEQVVPRERTARYGVSVALIILGALTIPAILIVIAEITKAGVEDVKAMFAQLKDEGRLPAIREAIRRSKAVDWLVENVGVTEVDEIAERRAAAESEEAEEAAAPEVSEDAE